MHSDAQKPMRLLVVDDHDDSREVLALALEAAGFAVVSASDGEAALSMVRADGPFDALLTDLTLPGMSGEQLALELNRERALRPRRLVAVSGRELSADTKKWFDGTFKKPLDVRTLPAQLRELLKVSNDQPRRSMQVSSLHDSERPDHAATRAVSSHALSLSATQCRTLLEQLPCLMWRCTNQLDCDWVNEGWLHYTRSSLEANVGQGWLTALHPDDVSAFCATLSTHAQTHLPFEVEVRLKRHDESYRWVLMRGAPFRDESGSELGLIATCFDVHERRGIDEGKARFLSTMAHELRTPLTPIGAYAHQLQRMASKGEPVPAEVSGKLTRQMERLASLADQLSDAARVERDVPLSLAVERVDLVPLVREAVDEQLAGHARLRGAEVPLRITCQLPDSPVYAVVDKQRIRQALRHLLSNAVKFGSADTIHVRLEDCDPVRIVVIDRGIGIPVDELRDVGRAYFRASNASSEEYPGAGLGLALSRHIARGHSGDLQLSTTDLGGVTAVLTLPQRAFS